MNLFKFLTKIKGFWKIYSGYGYDGETVEFIINNYTEVLESRTRIMSNPTYYASDVIKQLDEWYERLNMKVIVNNNVYEMPREQASNIKEIAQKYVPFGIYAVEKDGTLELKNDSAKSKTQLKRMVREYKEKGFKVYWNDDAEAQYDNAGNDTKN